MKNFQTIPAFLLVFVFLLGGCFLFEDDDTEETVVESVSVSPSTATVSKGATRQFTATVKGTNSPAQTVTWSIVETGKNSGTAINQSGLLTISASETLTKLTVKAVSTVDKSKSGTATVTVTSAPTATVTSVSVSPKTASVAHGGGQTFTATVAGNNSPAQTVTWSVSGNNKNTTIINSDGRLSVATDETAATLTVKATSTVDTTKSDTATVTVTALTATVTSVSVSPATANVSKGATCQFSVTVTGTNSPAQTVTWSIVESGKHSGTTINSSGLLTISASESLTSLTVRAASTVDTTKSGTAAVTVSQITTPVTPTDSRILNPTTTNTQLSGSGLTVSGSNHGGGNKWLIQPTQPPQSRAYGYETWDESGSPGSASFTWYGRDKGGGLAFKAEWTNVKDFLARTGYNWNESKPHSEYGNIYCGFNFTRSNRYNGNFSYIGIYGWSRNPNASATSERLIEYYIVEDSYGNRYRDAASYQLNIGNETLGINPSDPATGKEESSYTLDGATYKVFRKTRTGDSIAGNTTFTQFFSVRQTPRQSGTISITEHFRKWEERGMNLGTNIYECKFKVEAGGNENGDSSANPPVAPAGTGTFDARLIQFYRANNDGSIIEITQ